MAVAIATTNRWTLGDLQRLPDDGNKYEVIRGELYVTSAPTDEHETLLAKLTRLLDPFVAKHGLGFVYHPRAVFRSEGSEVEPDLMVRQPNSKRNWAAAPKPTLVVEVVSPTTRRRDREIKRDFYMSSGIPEYWIVDPDEREVVVVRAGAELIVARDELRWTPKGCAESMVVDLRALFSEV